MASASSRFSVSVLRRTASILGPFAGITCIAEPLRTQFSSQSFLQKMLEQPVVEEPDRTARESGTAAGEPVAVGAFDLLVEELDEPVVGRALRVAFEHEGDAEALRRRIEDELA